MAYTLNQVIGIIDTFASSHKQLKGSFYFGRLPDSMSEDDIQYPSLLIEPMPSQIQEPIETFTFKCFVLDRVDLKRENEQDSLSDTKLIANDFLFNFRQTLEANNPTLTVDTSVTMMPLIGAFDDLCNGWEFDVSFKQFNNFSKCSIPD